MKPPVVALPRTPEPCPGDHLCVVGGGGDRVVQRVDRDTGWTS